MKIFQFVWWLCVGFFTLSIVALGESGVYPMIKVVRVIFWLIPILLIERDLIKRYQLDLRNPKKELLAKAAIKKEGDISDKAEKHKKQLEEELKCFIDEDRK